MDSNRSGVFWQAVATMSIWVFVMGGIAIGGVFLADSLGEALLGFFFMLLAAAVVSTGFVWNWGRIPGDSRRRKRDEEELDYSAPYVEKRKHDRLSAALRDLSDQELVKLRERIASGEIGNEDLAYVLHDKIDARES